MAMSDPITKRKTVIDEIYSKKNVRKQEEDAFIQAKMQLILNFSASSQ